MGRGARGGYRQLKIEQGEGKSIGSKQMQESKES